MQLIKLILLMPLFVDNFILLKHQTLIYIENLVSYVHVYRIQNPLYPWRHNSNHLKSKTKHSIPHFNPSSRPPNKQPKLSYIFFCD